MTTIRDLWHQLTGNGDWELSCTGCGQPGKKGSRDEVEYYATEHNNLIHRGHPVAVVRTA